MQESMQALTQAAMEGCSTQQVLAVGCDCSSTPQVTFSVLALLGALWRARSRRVRDPLGDESQQHVGAGPPRS